MTEQQADPSQAAPTRGAAKRAAITAAARDLFLREGYVGTSMDDVAALARVSKQTVYKQFTDKEHLFRAIVLEEIAAAEQETQRQLVQLPDREDFPEALREFAYAHATGVVKPTIIALRRTIIGEATRFPDLARTWWDHGPQAGHETLAEVFRRAAAHGHLGHLDDPLLTAEFFNWLVLSIPLNRAMLLGQEALSANEDLRTITDEAVRIFLAAYAA
jgi:TetR/AcrR family transcriptional regulator, mexJK operon transcriptional repressor